MAKRREAAAAAPRAANLGPALRLEPTARDWVNRSLPRVMPHGWSEVREERDRDGVVYRNAFGLEVRISGAVRKDGRRWLYIAARRPDRDPDTSDLRLALDLFVQRGVTGLHCVVEPGTWAPHVEVVMICVDGPSVPPGVGANAEFG